MKKRKDHLQKEEITAVAAKLFAEKGFVGTSIRDISNALDVSVASIYYYFTNKEGLLYAIIDSIGEELLVALKEAKAEADSPTEQLRRMILSHMGLIREKGDRVKVYVEEQHNLSKGLGMLIYKQHQEIYGCYVKQLGELQRAGVLSCGPVSVTAFAIVGTLNWCYRWYNREGELSLEDLAERLTNILFYGIIDTKSPSQERSG